MRIKDYDEITGSEKDDGWVIVRCPICRAVWMDQSTFAVSNHGADCPYGSCDHLKFRLFIDSSGSSEEPYLLECFGDWDTTALKSALEQAFEDKAVDCREVLRKLDHPSDAIHSLDDFGDGIVIGDVFGYDEQEGNASAHDESHAGEAQS